MNRQVNLYLWSKLMISRGKKNAISNNDYIHDVLVFFSVFFIPKHTYNLHVVMFILQLISEQLNHNNKKQSFLLVYMF